MSGGFNPGRTLDPGGTIRRGTSAKGLGGMTPLPEADDVAFTGHEGADVDAALDARPPTHLSASSDPGTGDDDGDGHAPGCRWVNLATGEEFVCVDASTGAAVWPSTTAGGGSLTVEDADESYGSVDTLVFAASGDASVEIADDGGGQVTVTVGATGGGGGGSSGYDLDSYTLDGTYGDDFTGSSLSGSWTRRNYVSGDESYQLGKNATYLRIAKAGQAAGDGYFRSATSLPNGTYAMAFIPRFFTVSNLAWGIGIIDTNGTGIATCFYGTTPNAPLLIQVTTYSTYGGAYVQPGASGGSPNVNVHPNAFHQADRKVWVYIRKSGTNYYMAYSLDGEAWSPESSALAWAGTPDRIGMMDAPLGTVTSGAGTGSFVDVDWFNKIA